MVVLRLCGEPRCERAVVQRQVLHLDAVAGDTDPGLAARETDDAGFHVPDDGAGL
jgi:hypothetical protein